MGLWGNVKFSPKASSVFILFYPLKPDILSVDLKQVVMDAKKNDCSDA
jgi:hypothetical protein